MLDLEFEYNISKYNEDKKDISIAENKYLQVFEYNSFHKKIKKFFSERVNIFKKGEKQKLYFIDSKWLDDWKIYSNYNEVVEKLDKSYDYFIKNKILYQKKDKF